MINKKLKISLVIIFGLNILICSKINAEAVDGVENNISTTTNERISTSTLEKKSQKEKKILVSPTIIDEKIEVKGLSKFSINVKNNTDNKVNIYASVNDVLINKGRQEFLNPSKMDRKTSLASWIKFRRGVIELDPDEEIDIPVEIKAAIDAIPGKYYASIAFPVGSNRKMAEASMNTKNYPQTMINLELEKIVIDKAQINSFLTSKNVFFNGSDIDFKLNIDNIGTEQINPFGAIYIFSRQGKEVDKIEIKKGSSQIGANNSFDIIKKVNKDIGYGKFKAKVELEYGNKCLRDMQDTLFFWVLPWKFLLGFLGAFVMVIILTFFILRFKKYG